jgi:hypothetical protein
VIGVKINPQYLASNNEESSLIFHREAMSPKFQLSQRPLGPSSNENSAIVNHNYFFESIDGILKRPKRYHGEGDSSNLDH